MSLRDARSKGSGLGRWLRQRLAPSIFARRMLVAISFASLARCPLAFAQGEPIQDPPSIVSESTKMPSSHRSADAFSKRVATLLEQLAQGSLEQRESAEKELLEIGPTILSHLPRLRSSDVGDYRDALDRIRDAMQSKAIGEYAQASTVSLKGKLPVADVLLELMDQTDNKLTIEQIPHRELDVNFEKAGFWQALDIVLDELGLDVTTHSQDQALVLVPAKDEIGMRASRGTYAGVFRIEPRRVQATRSIKADNLSHLNLEITLMWEPRLRPVFFKFPMNQVFVECNNGELLEAATRDASPEYTPTDAHAIDVSLMLDLPSREAKSIRRLSGSMIAAIPGAMVQLEFDELDKLGVQSQKVGNLSVKIEETKKHDDIGEFKLLISLREAGQTMDSFRGWLLSHEAYLVDSTGKKTDNAGWQTYRMNEESVGLSYFFELKAPLEEYRLMYSAPGAVTEQRVDFVLKDIPLP